MDEDFKQNDPRIVDDQNLMSGPPGCPEMEMDNNGNQKADLIKRKIRTPEQPRSVSRERGSGYGERERRYSSSRRRSPPPPRRRSRSRDRRDHRSRENYRGNRRSRSVSRGRNRRDWSPKGRRRPRTPPAPPPPPQLATQNYVPQPMYGDQYNAYATNPGAIPYVPAMTNQYNNAYGYVQQPNQNPYMANYVPPPPMMSQVPPDFNQQWQQQVPQNQPQTPVEPPMIGTSNDVDPSKQREAVAQEMQQQRATLKKQKEDYQQRAVALKRELKILKEQRGKLTSGSSEPRSPTTKNFLKENDRLQSQIENKLSTIDNVIDMLTGIIGKDPSPPPIKGRSRSSSSGSSSSDKDSEPEKLKNKVMESMRKRKSEKERNVEVDEVPEDKKINYAFYDPEMHWCKQCEVFPKTAKDYLNHLHSKEHQEMAKKHIDAPWHDNNKNVEMPHYPNAPSKRNPIRGLQFFVPSTAWFCKLCSMWMGDLHCASLHLKSSIHAESYIQFIEHNPHFEMDWMGDRQKAYDLVRDKNPSALAAVSRFENIPFKYSISQLESGVLAHVNPSAAPQLPPAEEKKGKKKKSKKEKKSKKKRGKKRKQSDSSSEASSSSSEEESSDSESSGNKVDSEEEARAKITLKTQSIRNAMRSLETVEKKKEPVRIWPAAETTNAITEAERRFVDGLREKTSRDRDQQYFPRRNDRGDRGERRYRRRSRSRSRSRSRGRRYGGRRRSWSRSRSRSRVIEKAVVRLPPEFKARIAQKAKQEEKRKKSPKRVVAPTNVSGKKLPFIGRMPVFKKQTQDEQTNKAKEDEEEQEDGPPKVEVQNGKNDADDYNSKMRNDDDELMPDPDQLIMLMRGPPPPPSMLMSMDKDDEVLPPGIDETEMDSVPKQMMNDGPMQKKGPLPKDLEDALNIIFPGEKPPSASTEPERKPFIVKGHIKDNGTEIITGPEPQDEVSQNTMEMYETFSAYANLNPDFNKALFETANQIEQETTPEMVPPPPPPMDITIPETAMDEIAPEQESSKVEEEPKPVVLTEEQKAAQMELDDLAMLGIDASDLAAQNL